MFKSHFSDTCKVHRLVCKVLEFYSRFQGFDLKCDHGTRIMFTLFILMFSLSLLPYQGYINVKVEAVFIPFNISVRILLKAPRGILDGVVCIVPRSKPRLRTL